MLALAMQAPPGPAPKKKSGSGCVVALAVVGGLALLAAGVVAFGAYRFATSEEGKVILSAVGEGARLLAEAQSAPGAAEVRGLGCDQAMVVDMDKIGTLVEQFDAGKAPPGTFSKMVTCQIGYFESKTPSCDDVARTYVAAAGPPPRGFAVSVSRQGGEALCTTIHQPDGTKLADIDAGP
jgi:hypothetical protein